MRRGAFTLIEMLVVLAIIVLLASILVPAVTGAIGKARITATASNMRQIGVGILGYALDNREKLPVRYGYSEQVHGRAMHWQEQIQPYLGHNREGSVFDYRKNPVFYSKNAERIGGQHFGLNKFMFEDEPRWAYRYDIIPNSSGIVIVGEINQNTSEFDPEAEPVFKGDEKTKYRISHPGDRAVYLFADGHVEVRKGDQGMDVNPDLWKWW